MAESLTFKIGADTKAFQNGIKDAMKGLAGLAAGFVGIRAVVDSFNNALDLGGRMSDLSKRTGDTAGNLAVLERAFDNAGSSAEKVGPAINKMQETIQDAAEGTEEAVDALSMLGLNAEELGKKLPTDQMEEIAAKLVAIENPTSRAAAAMGVFGKSGGELVPLLLNFNGEIDQARRQLGSLPDILNKSADQIDGVGDNIAGVRRKINDLSFAFWATLLPAASEFSKTMSEIDAAGFGKNLGEGIRALATNFMTSVSAIDLAISGAVKSAGNEVIAWTKYAIGTWKNFFQTAGFQLIPEIAKILGGALALQAGRFIREIIEGLMDVSVALENIPGFDKQANSMFQALDEANNKIFEAQKGISEMMKESGDYIVKSFEKARAITPFIREDLLGADKDKENAANIAKMALDPKKTPSGKPASTDKRETAMAHPGGGGGGKPKKEKETSLEDIQEYGTGTLIGQSASARKAIEYKAKEMQRRIRGDVEGANRAAALAAANEARARGLVLNQKDLEHAEQYAFDQFAKGDPRKLSKNQLVEEAKKNILEGKMKGADKADKDKMLAGGGGGDPQSSILKELSTIRGYLADTMGKSVKSIDDKLPQQVIA